MNRAVIVETLAFVVMSVAAFSVFQHQSTSARTTDARMSMTVSAGGTCNAGVCAVPLNGTFTLQVNIDAGLTEGYIGIQTEVDYSNLVANGGRYNPATQASFGVAELVWPPGVFPLRAPVEPPPLSGLEGTIHHADGTGLSNPPKTTYTGPALALSMTCGGTNSTNVMMLLPYNAATNSDGSGFRQSLTDGNQSIPAKATPLTVTCDSLAPTPTPTGDTDGDGCTDSQENGSNEELGGRRNYVNPWDFYDVDGNMQIDLFFDIYAVAFAFGQGPGDPGYSMAKDRSPPPPPWEEPDATKREVWDMDAPDGIIDLFVDVFGVAFQYGHHCE
jgi:hypothetical protein